MMERLAVSESQEGAASVALERRVSHSRPQVAECIATLLAVVGTSLGASESRAGCHTPESLSFVELSHDAPEFLGFAQQISFLLGGTARPSPSSSLLVLGFSPLSSASPTDDFVSSRDRTSMNVSPHRRRSRCCLARIDSRPPAVRTCRRPTSLLPHSPHLSRVTSLRRCT